MRELVASFSSRIAIALVLVATALAPASALAQPAPAASDGQTLSSQSSATQAMFNAVWDGQAAQEWVKEHNAAIAAKPSAGGTAASVPTDFSSLTPGPATCPAPGSTATSNISMPKVTAERVASDTTNETLTKSAVPAGAQGRVIKIDIMVLDQAGQKLYVADRDTSGVDVFDVSGAQPKFVTTFKTPTQPNGVVLAGSHVVAGLCDSTGVEIDLTSGQITGTVSTGGKGRADELDYDPVDNKVYLANSDDGILTAIDMGSFKIIKQFTGLGAGLEQPRYDSANGKMYLTSGNGLYEFDPTNDTQINLDSRSEISGCTGIQINPKTNQGVISCSSLMSYDFSEGAPIGPIEQACAGDELAFSQALDIYASPAGTNCRFGATASFVGGTPIAFVTNVPIVPGVHGTQINDSKKVAYVMGPDGLYTFPVPGR